MYIYLYIYICIYIYTCIYVLTHTYMKINSRRGIQLITKETERKTERERLKRKDNARKRERESEIVKERKLTHDQVSLQIFIRP